MKILVINSGSSSLKFQVIDMDTETMLAKGNCEKIGAQDSFVKYSVPGKKEIKNPVFMKDHTEATKVALDCLTKGELAILGSISEIDAIGNRIVQGGDYFKKACIVDDDVIERIEGYYSIAPLHAIANAAAIRACRKIVPDIPQTVVFDTAFHQTMPEYAYMYGLPMEYYEKYKIRKYGFHGTSHKYVSRRAAEYLGRPIEELKLVICHLGNGSSLSAVKYGKCIDTSMGLTPLEGPMMGTRCGSVDPAAVAVIIDKEHLTGAQMNDIMNKKSGMLAISGVSADFRDVNDAWDNDRNPRAKLALDMFGYQCKKLLGGYIAAMNGVDAVVFTAGVGENRPETRARICSDMDYFGIKIDLEKNDVMGKDVEITAEGSKVRVLVLGTNEELEIARETVELVKDLRR